MINWDIIKCHFDTYHIHESCLTNYVFDMMNHILMKCKVFEFCHGLFHDIEASLPILQKVFCNKFNCPKERELREKFKRFNCPKEKAL